MLPDALVEDRHQCQPAGFTPNPTTEVSHILCFLQETVVAPLRSQKVTSLISTDWSSQAVILHEIHLYSSLSLATLSDISPNIPWNLY